MSKKHILSTMSDNTGIVTRGRRYGGGALMGMNPQANSNSQIVTQIATLDDNGNMTNMLETTTTVRNGKKVVKSMAMDYHNRTITRQIARSRFDSKKISESSKVGTIVKTIKPIAKVAAKSKAVVKPKAAEKPVFEVNSESAEMEESEESDELEESDDDSGEESATAACRMRYTPWSSMMKSSFDEFSKAFGSNGKF